jgi:single-stranded DNA-binding protein
MPTLATATVIGHLYGPTELKDGTHGKWCRIRLWTSDKIKGQDEKKFTTWGGMVNGPQAEWIARDGKKGTLVCVTGTVRLDKYVKADKTESYSIEFTRISECRSLEGRDEQKADTAAPAPARPSAPAAGGAGDDDSPPFMRRGEWE